MCAASAQLKLFRFPLAARTLPLTATSSLATPGTLTAAEQAKWHELAARFPHLRVGHADLLWVYCSAWCDWNFYRDQLRAFGNGSHLMKGPGGRAAVSPYVAMARDAMRMLLDYSDKLGFSGSREGATVAREQTKLEKFLAKKAGR